MSETVDPDTLLALGELRGMLAAFAWANRQAGHHQTFVVVNLPGGADLYAVVARFLDGSATRATLTKLDNWPSSVTEALRRWLFRFVPGGQHQAAWPPMDPYAEANVSLEILYLIEAGLQPLVAWRVEIEPLHCSGTAWDEFVIRGASGHFLLHLGTSD